LKLRHYCPFLLTLVFNVGFLGLHVRAADDLPVVDAVDWAAMLSKQDMIWNQLPRGWKEAPYITPDVKEDRELIQLSLSHWHSFKRPLAGYSATGGACMAAMLGDGEQAFGFLNRLRTFLHPNTFYSEAGSLPVIETPLHGATAIQEMLLQSWGGRLRVFPAVPAEWPDVQIHQLRGEGAFLVSARREQGSTKWVAVRSEVGGMVEVDPCIAEAQWTASQNLSVKSSENGFYQIDTSLGDWIVFYPKGTPQPDTSVTFVSPHGTSHRFGKP
jgi:hypothetical protein